MKPGKQEPSLSMLRRMAHSVGPEAIFKFIVSARRERDGLREALAMRLSGMVTGLAPGTHDTIVLRWPGPPKPEVLGALEDLRKRLRQRMGWEGELLVLTGGATAQVLELAADDVLVVRKKGRFTPDEVQQLEDVIVRLRESGVWAGRALVFDGDVEIEVRPADSVEKTAESGNDPGQDSDQSGSPA